MTGKCPVAGLRILRPCSAACSTKCRRQADLIIANPPYMMVRPGASLPDMVERHLGSWLSVQIS